MPPCVGLDGVRPSTGAPPTDPARPARGWRPAAPVAPVVPPPGGRGGPRAGHLPSRLPGGAAAPDTRCRASGISGRRASGFLATTTRRGVVLPAGGSGRRVGLPPWVASHHHTWQETWAGGLIPRSAQRNTLANGLTTGLLLSPKSVGRSDNGVQLRMSKLNVFGFDLPSSCIDNAMFSRTRTWLPNRLA